MARNRTEQQANLYVCSHQHPGDRAPLGVETFSRAAVSDLLMHVDELLGFGYQVTITPPANPARPPSRIAGVSHLPPQHLDVVDIQIIG